MLILRTGLPGASKTLNSLKDVCHSHTDLTRPIYYNNIKHLCLDFEFLNTFQAFFYCVYFPNAPKSESRSLKNISLRVHSMDKSVTLDDVPHLAQMFDAWHSGSGAVDLFLFWVRRVYPKKILKPLDDFLALNAQPTLDQLSFLNLDWRHLPDPTQWHELPRSSIIVLDECQRWFPPRAVGSKVPIHVSEFETHRHKGYDVHMITQDAKLLDNSVRRLTGRHIHYKSAFGSNRISRLESQSVFDPTDYFQAKNAEKSVIKRDSNFYGLYHSADVHTHKVRIPKAVYMAIAAFFMCGVVIYLLINRFSGSSSDSSVVRSQPVQSSVSQPVRNMQSSSNPALFTGETLSKLTHALSDRCSAIEYRGYETVRTSKGIKQNHFFSCVSDLTVGVQQSSNSDSDSESSDTVVDVVRSELLTADYLSKFGFRLRVVQGYPALEYQGSVYLFDKIY